MNRLLAIETSGRTGGVAAADDRGVLAVRTLGIARAHAAALLPAVDSLCRELGWRPVDIGVVAVSAGPGSFTGVRIGVTFAKSLALAAGAKVVAVASPDVLAENAPGSAEHVGIVQDAKRGEVFASGYRREPDGRLVKTFPDRVCTPAELLAGTGRPLYLIGEGLRNHAAALAGEGVEFSPEDRWHPDPVVCARLGAELAARGAFADADALVPTYLRRPEAEEVWEKRYGTK